MAPELPGPDIDMLKTLLGYAERTGPLERPGGSALAGEEPEQLDLEAIPAAVASLFTGLAGESPVLLMVDDLHDATPETVANELLTLLSPTDAAVLTGDVASFLLESIQVGIERRLDGWIDDDLGLSGRGKRRMCSR